MTRRLADRYRIIEQVGAGGSSHIYAAIDERLGRRVAVKLLNADLVASADPAGRERFLREGPTAAAFQHRHAVTVFDAGEDAGELFIVMEFVDGPSLAEHLASTGPLAIDEASRIAEQVLAALAAAHAVGIVHRDVKPANILLGNDGDAKLADFGIAKRFEQLEGSFTRTGMVIGTPRYLTPEQATGAPISPATDVYAVGIVLFEMLTGRTPFTGDSPIAVALAQQSQPAVDVRTLRADVPAKLAATVARALAKQPSERYSTAGEMAADLAIVWSAPVAPPPESAIPTQVMDTVQPALGVRGGDTEVMPTAVAIDRTAESSPPTTGSTTRRAPMAAVAVIAVVTIVALLALALSLLAGNDDIGTPADTETSATEAAATTASPTPSPTTLPPTTAAPTTPVTIATTLQVDEIIPGFARTNDLAVFLQQTEVNPQLVGAAGAELADSLGRLLDERSAKKQRDKAKALSSQLGQWVDAGELDPAIAQALEQLLEPLTAKEK